MLGTTRSCGVVVIDVLGFLRVFDWVWEVVEDGRDYEDADEETNDGGGDEGGGLGGCQWVV